MRVRHGQTFRFDPVPLDSVLCPEHCKGFKKGDLVKVVQLPMAPPPGTMGQANIQLVGN